MAPEREISAVFFPPAISPEGFDYLVGGDTEMAKTSKIREPNKRAR
jgi:hypothetical protein